MQLSVYMHARMQLSVFATPYITHIYFAKSLQKVFTKVNFMNAMSLPLLLVTPQILVEVNFASLSEICENFQPQNICYVLYYTHVLACVVLLVSVSVL